MDPFRVLCIDRYRSETFSCHSDSIGCYCKLRPIAHKRIWRQSFNTAEVLIEVDIIAGEVLKSLCRLFKMFLTDIRKEFYDVVVNQVSALCVLVKS